MATASNKLLYGIRESTFATAPTTGAMVRLRNVSENLDITGETATSEEMSGNRRAPYNRQSGRTVGGTLKAELTYGEDTIFNLENQMCGTATAMTKTATTISVTASTRTIADSEAGFDTNKFRVGEKITTTGFTTPANNLTGIIATVSASAITLTTDMTDLVDEAAGASVTITSGTLRLIAGTTRRSATYLRDQSDITTGRYRSFLGVQSDELSIDYAPKKFNTYSITFKGIDDVSSDTAPSGVTLGAITETHPMNAIESSVTIAGSEVGVVTAYAIKSPNGIAVTDVIGSSVGAISGGVSDTTIDNIKPTATLTVLLNNSSAAYDASMKAGTVMAIECTSADLEGNKIRVGLPSAKITSAPESGDGNAIRTKALTIACDHNATIGGALYIDFIPV